MVRGPPQWRPLFCLLNKSATLSRSTFCLGENDVAIQYPDSHEELREEIARLSRRNKELIIELMRKSAKLSEAEETLKRWRTELEIVAEQKGHNLCWMWIPRLLKATLGHTGKYPDSDNVTREEFELGCQAYQDDIFGQKT